MDIKPTFKNFLLSFANNWFTAMSGGLSVPLAIAAFYIDNDGAKVALNATAMVCAVFASYRIWATERTRNTALQEAVKSLQSQIDSAAAVREQTEELRHSREQRERESDPFIRAFNEEQYRNVLAGSSSEERALHFILWWIVNRSAWGRWQAARSHVQIGDRYIQRISSSYFLDFLVSARIAARGRRAKIPNAYEFISPDYWKDVYICVFPDERTITKALIFPRACTEPRDSAEITDNTYMVIVCEWATIIEFFPEKDEQIDEVTASILETSS